MPQGVEHTATDRLFVLRVLVDLASMPQGVEHAQYNLAPGPVASLTSPRCRKALSTARRRLRHAVATCVDLASMPQGVEHMKDPKGLIGERS